MAVTVPFDECVAPENSPQGEKWELGGKFSATRYLRCAWADRHTLALQLLGFDGSTYGNPEAYPGVASSLVQSVVMSGNTSIETSAVGATLNSYTEAILAVQYGVRVAGATTQSGTGVIMEESVAPSAEFLTQDGQEFYWEPVSAGGTRTPLAVNDAPARIVRMAEWQVTLYNVASVPSTYISAAGSVNNHDITSLTLGVVFPAETLQFQPGPVSRSFNAAGPSRWKLSMSFSARPFPWNKFFRSGRTEPQNIYQANGDIYQPYTPINFASQLNVVY